MSSNERFWQTSKVLNIADRALGEADEEEDENLFTQNILDPKALRDFDNEP